ncbi:MAG: hypothetical protein WBL58_02615, partial [Peptococcia bacterium]
GQPTQTISLNVLNPGLGVSSESINKARIALQKPAGFRSVEDLKAIESAYYMTGAEKQFIQQEQVKFKQQQLMRQATFGSNDPRFNINRDFPLPGDRRYISDSKSVPLRDYVEPYKQKPSERTLGLPKNIVDISEAEYQVGVKKVTDEVPNMFDIVGKRLEERAKGFENIFEGTGSVKVAPQKFGVYGTEFLTTQYVPGEKQETIFKSPLVRTVRAGYDTLSDVASIFIAGGTKSFLTGGMLIGKKELIKYQAEGILNPRQAALEDVKGKQKQYIEETESDFYFSKQLVETSAILAGGNIGLIASIGSASRAEKVEDIILPLSLGVVGRLAAKPLGGLVSGLTGRTNKGIDYLEGILSSKSPVVKDVVVPNLLPRLTDSMVSKGLLIAGGGVELVGMQLTPLEQKEEYLRQVGLFNAYTPLGYRVTDVGLMVGKRVGVQALDVGFGLSEKYLGKDIRGFDTARYSDLAGEDLMKTPKFVGSEREMLLASQDIKRPGAAKFAFEKFDIVPEEQGIGFGFRSSSGKLGDIVEPKLTYYEGTKIDFFAPEINPIAMRGSGLKNKLFGKLPSLGDEYSLVPPEPALQLAAFKKATAVSIKEGVSFSDKTLDDLFDIYGWKGTNVSFSKDVTLGGVKVPKGKTFGEIMTDKIVGGDYGRPLKSREIIGITNEDVFDKTFIDMSKSKVKEVGGIFSSPSRSLGATSESEFVTAVVRERVAPMSKSRAFFKKLGFADAYVYYDWDVVPINYYKEVSKKVPLISGTNNALTIMDNKRLTGGQKNLFLEDSKKLLPGDSFELTTTRSSLVAVQKGQGGYSKELEDVFGTSTSGKKSVFSKSILKPMVTMEETKVEKESRQKDYDKQYLGVYSGTYVIPYAKDYVSSYDVVYPVERVKDYDSVYTPTRTTPYTPTYTPPYDPPYVPKRTPPYKPTYTPPYTPTYNPPYVPKRTPPYKPTYTPPYIPPYTPPYTPPPKTRLYNIQTKETSSKKKQKGYFSLVKKKGKWRKIDKTPRTFNAAWNKAAKEADKTLSQSIKIIEAGRPAIGKEERLNLGKFRPSKRTLGVLVEKKKFALERDELVEIKSAKKQKQGIGKFKLSL